jgi:starch phosphorylase
LHELSYNLWWTWHPEAARLFGRLDYELWERLGHNPIRLLREIERARLKQAASDKDYLKLYKTVFADFDSYFSDTNTWTHRDSA